MIVHGVLWCCLAAIASCAPLAYGPSAKRSAPCAEPGCTNASQEVLAYEYKCKTGCTIYLSIYLSIYLYIHCDKQTYRHTNVYIIYIHTHMHTCTHACNPACMPACLPACMHACMHACMQDERACAHTMTYRTGHMDRHSWIDT